METTQTIAFGGKTYDFITRTESGYDVTVNDGIVLREIFEENVYQVLDGHLRHSGVAVDIGGNIGAFSIYAAALGAKKVYTYEPDSLNYPVLTANVERNGFADIIHPAQLGVSGTSGDAELLQGQGASFLLGCKIPTPEAAKRAKDAPIETVHTTTLERIFVENDITKCDILKVDCEGSEYQIMEAVPSEILRRIRYITMEFHITDDITFGKMIAKLTQTHNTHIIGSYTTGGQIYASRY